MADALRQRPLAERLAEGPLPLDQAVPLLLDLLDAAEERWNVADAPARIDPGQVLLPVAEPAPGQRRAQLGSSPAAAPEDESPGPVPSGVRALAGLLATMLGADPASLKSGESTGGNVPAPVRPLLRRAFFPESGWPPRTWGALRESLWNVLHLLEPAGALAVPGEGGQAGMPAGIVRRVRLDATGKAGKRDAAWCVVRLSDGHFGQAVLVVDPEAMETAHHARTLRCLWPGAELTAWGLPAPGEGSTGDAAVFLLRPETVLVLEPRRLFEITAVASAHDVGCPLHVLAGLAQGTGDTSPWLIAGRMADDALHELLEHPERSDAAIVGEALRARRADAVWLRTEAVVERAAGIVRTAVPAIRAWLERRGVGPGAMHEVSRRSGRFGIAGRSDLVLPRSDGAPLVGELKSGSSRRFAAAAPATDLAALRGYHVAQARLYALLWSDAWRRSGDSAATQPTFAELFYAGSSDAFRIGPEPREVSRILATRNAMLDVLRRAADGEGLPGPPPLARCGDCFERATCPAASARTSPLGFPTAEGRRGPDESSATGAAYARHFSRLLFRSIWHAQGRRREQLEPSTLSSRVGAMTAEVDLALRFDRRSHRIVELTGDLRGSLRTEDGGVLVHRGDPGALDSFDAGIEHVGPQGYRLKLAWPRPPWLAEGSGWIVEEPRSAENEREAFEGLARLLYLRDPALLDALLGADVDAPAPGPPLAVPAPWFAGEWHASQREALERGLNGGRIELIQGPPGTGKTVFVGALVAALVRAGRRVVVGALTHNAADQAARRIVEAGVHDLLRVGARPGASVLTTALAAAGIEPATVLFEEFARQARDLGRVQARLFGAPVLVATCHRLARLPFRGRSAAGGRPPFDVAVLDEATQIAEPAALATIALAGRAVLVGDPQQLSCVEPSDAEWPPDTVPEPLAAAGVAGLGRSLHERLCALRRSTMLRLQHRMHERIMALPNRAFYGGALEAAPDARARQLEVEPGRAGAVPAWLEVVLRPDEPLVLVDVPGGSEDRLNEREAALVAEAAAALRRAGVAAGRLGIVTPYRAQVGLLRRLLGGDPLLAGIVVDTVERYQGDERDAILVSLVGGRPTGHLAHPNRLNVTLTRARSKLVVFGDAAGLSRDPLLAELVRQPETTRVRAP